jgi:hypothetical protein
MRKIFKGEAVAWIGESAPVPDGWSLDINAAGKDPDPVKEEGVTPEWLTRPNDFDPPLPDLDNMAKDELEAFALEKFGVNIDKRKKKDTLVDEVLALIIGG